MTTKFHDNKICTFKILLPWRFPRKTAFWTISSLPPRPAPPQKANIYFYCRLAVSFVNQGVFKSFFRHSSSIVQGSSALKNAWKALDLKSRVFSGFFRRFSGVRQGIFKSPFRALLKFKASCALSFLSFFFFFRSLGRTFTRLTRVSLVTRVRRSFFGALFGQKHRTISRKPSREGHIFSARKSGCTKLWW